MPDKILLIEDDVKLTQLLSTYLQRNGFDVAAGHRGDQALALLNQTQPDILILDLMLPGLDGLSVCREIRGAFAGKILILTASDDDMDQVAALEMGADDFVCKPLQPRVLLARIRMLLRRQPVAGANEEGAESGSEPTQAAHQLQLGALSLNQLSHVCLLDTQRVNLTPGEFDLLWLLASHQDEALSRDTLVKTTRGIEYDGVDRTIDNKIAILRKKLGDDAALPRRIITVRGKGYMLLSDQW